MSGASSGSLNDVPLSAGGSSGRETAAAFDPSTAEEPGGVDRPHGMSPARRSRSTLFKVLIGLAVIAAGVGIAAFLLHNRKAEVKPVVVLPPVVRAVVVAESVRRAGEPERRHAAGFVDTKGPRVYLRLDGAIDNVDVIRDLPITAGGRTLKIGDIADVHRGYADPPTELIRNQGIRSLTKRPGRSRETRRTIRVRLLGRRLISVWR